MARLVVSNNNFMDAWILVMRVGFLVFDDVEELDFVGPLEVFGITSTLTGKVQVLTISKDGRPVKCRHGLKVQPDYSFRKCPSLDLLIVPGGKGAREFAMRDSDVLSFIRSQATNAHIASVCTGALVLAETGLLRGHKATTHHAYLRRLEGYPNIKVVRNSRYVREGNVSTSAGISAGIDLALAIIREKFGNKIAREVVRDMEYVK